MIRSRPYTGARVTVGRASAVPRWVWPAVFLGPYMVGLAMFVVGPILAGFGLSFARWDLFGKPAFAGLTNFATLVTDPLFWKALVNTLYYVALVVPVEIAVALGLALLVQGARAGAAAYRTMFFLPSVLSLAVIGLLWSWLYAPVYGLLNQVLQAGRIPAPAWLATPEWALPAVAITTIWRNAGYYMAIYIAALQAIPHELHEAAALDGTSAWQRLRHITVPLLSPATFMIGVVATIWAFQVFDLTYIMTRGGPSNATLTLVYYIYLAGFQWGRMGYASALAVALFIVTIALTLGYFASQRRWVYYA
jgi:multiple sugar transport system permease protein